jgi:hypothetical protein
MEVVLVDVDGDGTIDAAITLTSDGEADYVETTTTVLSDVDGDGIADAIDRHTVTEVNIDGESQVIEEVEEEITVLGGTASLGGDTGDDGA